VNSDNSDKIGIFHRFINELFEKASKQVNKKIDYSVAFYEISEEHLENLIFRPKESKLKSSKSQ